MITLPRRPPRAARRPAGAVPRGAGALPRGPGPRLRIGEAIAAEGLPTAFVFEGGYAIADVGINAVHVLDGLAQRAG